MLLPPFNCTGTLSKPSSQKLVFSLLFEGVSIESVFAFASRRGARVPILHRKKKKQRQVLTQIMVHMVCGTAATVWISVPRLS